MAISERKSVLGGELLTERSLPLDDAVSGDLIDETVDTGVDDGDLDLSGHGNELGLLEQLDETNTTVKGGTSGSVQVRTELGESGKLTVLGKRKLERTRDRLVELRLGSGTDTRYGKTDVDSGTNTLEEELGLEVNLTVSDRDNVGGNESGHITTLGLNDGEGSERSTTVGVVHLGGTLEETRVEVENVTG